MFLTLLKAGDHLVASKFVFGNTNSVFGTLADLGIEVTTVDVTDARQVAAAVRPHTRMVFVETIANPGTQMPDLEGIGALCKERGLLYVVDNTVASPYLFRPGTVGAGLVVHSLTKSIGGQGDALGGVVIDTGVFDWSTYPNIFPAYRKGDAKGWGLQQVRKKGLRDMGGACRPMPRTRWRWAPKPWPCAWTAPAPPRWPWPGGWSSTLPWRGCITRCWSRTRNTRSAQKAPQGGLVAAVIRTARPRPVPALCNRLQLPIKATGLADTRTLIIPVAHTIFWEAGP
jgi:O-acetylhomoserine (thiol)-lyase